MEFRPRSALTRLASGEVRFVVVGGIAAAMLGSLRETTETDLGEIDVLIVGKGGWTYTQAVERAEVVDVDGRPVHLISVDDLIAMKRAAGRPKDIETAAELEALKALQERS